MVQDFEGEESESSDRPVMRVAGMEETLIKDESGYLPGDSRGPQVLERSLRNLGRMRSDDLSSKKSSSVSMSKRTNGHNFFRESRISQQFNSPLTV